MKNVKKTKKLRSEVKNPNLNTNFHSRSKREYIDMDYVKDLSEDMKTYLNKFIGEYYAADMDFDNLENNLHSTEELKKDCTDRNNARNRCVYTAAKAQNRVLDIVVDKDESFDRVRSDQNLEDALIEVLDKQFKEEKDEE